MIFHGIHTVNQTEGQTPDYRVLLVMSGFTGETEEDAVFLDDITTVDEYDGLGYTAYDCAGVSIAYDTATDELEVDYTAGGGDEFGAAVGPCTDVIHGTLLVVGDPATPATCRVIAFSTEGAGGNGDGGPLGHTIPSAGWLYAAAG